MANGLALGSLNRARYAGLDFDTHNDDLLSRLQVKFAADFNDFSISSLGIMLIDLTAYGLDTLSFYVDRRATDTYLSTARTRKSVSRTSRQLGYKMGGAVASSVDVEVGVTEVFSFDVTIPERFQFDGPDGLIFESSRDVLYTPSEQGINAGTKFIPCYEGETLQESFVSDGTSAQVFDLRRVPDGKFVVQGTVIVTVDGAEWDEVGLFEYGATDQFEVGYNDEPATVRCGDGIAGNIPPAGASVVVTYVASRGKAGQVSRDTIQQETNSLVVSFTEIPLSINNPAGSVGGDDRETLASAKAFAPLVRKSGGVAVVDEDYYSIAGSYADPLFGRVAVAKAISSRSAATDLTVQNYLTAIYNAVSVLNASLVSSTDAIDSDLDDIDTAVANIAAEVTSITSNNSTITSEATSARTYARTVKDNTGEISVDATDIGDRVTSGKAAVDAITTHATTSQLTTADKDIIKGWFNLIDDEADNIGIAAGNAESAANSIVSDANSILDEVAEAATSLSTVSTNNSTVSARSASIRSETGTIDTENATLVAVVNPSDSDSAAYGINEHFDKILSADCKANLVTVPILVRDSGGFYTAPSSGLIDSLQTHLDSKKEVTQTVAVTSGENFLIRAVIRARVGVLDNYSESSIQKAVESVINGVLRDRKFGVALKESDLDKPILEIEGVDFVIVRIEGYLASDGVTVLTDKLDDGNLIILSSEIITRGTTTITTEVVSTSTT